MADSDDEYDRKRRDKFRGERTESYSREGRRGEDRRREEWVDRYVANDRVDFFLRDDTFLCRPNFVHCETRQDILSFHLVRYYFSSIASISLVSGNGPVVQEHGQSTVNIAEVVEADVKDIVQHDLRKWHHLWKGCGRIGKTARGMAVTSITVAAAAAAVGHLGEAQIIIHLLTTATITMAITRTITGSFVYLFIDLLFSFNY